MGAGQKRETAAHLGKSHIPHLLKRIGPSLSSRLKTTCNCTPAKKHLPAATCDRSGWFAFRDAAVA